MMNDDFDILATRVLAGEALADERARLETMLAASPEHRQEFAEMQSTWKALQAASPLLSALRIPPAPVPEGRLKRLRAAVKANLSPPKIKALVLPLPPRNTKQRSDHLAWGLAASVLLLATIAGFQIVHRNQIRAPSVTVAYLLTLQGETEIRRDGRKIPSQKTALLGGDDEIQIRSGSQSILVTSNGTEMIQGPRQFVVRAAIDSKAAAVYADAASVRTALFHRPSDLRRTSRGGERILLYSPNGTTTRRTPVIVWKGEPGKKYDLLITDVNRSATPPWILTRAEPPVTFEKEWPQRALAEEGLYRLRLTESGNPASASEYTFRVVKNTDLPLPESPAARLGKALSVLASDSPAIGDALADLFTLPPELAKSELAMRLKALAFARLGYNDDLDVIDSTLAPRP